MNFEADQIPAERQLPQNVEAEAATLGAMMIDNRLADDLLDKLQPEHFFEPLHGRVFSAIRSLRANDMTASPITLRPMFESDAGMASLGGPSYLGMLTGSGAGLIGARQFAKQIVDLAQIRTLIEVGRTLVADGMDTSEEVNPRALLERAEAALSCVSLLGNSDPKALSLAAAWDAAFKELDAVASGQRERGVVIPAFVEWNEICGGGMMAGQLILLGGRPGMGKTAVALAVARRAAEGGAGVLFISREMSVVGGLMMRIVADMLFEAGSPATFDDVLNGRLSVRDRHLAADIRERIAEWPLTFEEPQAIAASGIGSMIRRTRRQMERKGQSLKLVVVDYLGLIDAPMKRGNREQEMSDISRMMKGTARDNGVALLALAQLNRGVEQREDKRPLLADLRDSGSLEQDADTVVFAYRAEYYLRQTEPDARDPQKHEAWEIEMGAERDRLDVYSAKVRQGEPLRRKVYFFGGRQAVRNADYMRSGGGGPL